MPKSIIGLTNPAEEVKHLKALFYGAPGTGKTQLAGTAPKPLILDVDGGATTLRSVPGVDVFPIKRWSDIDDALYTLMTMKHEWETVVIDTITTLQEVAANEVDLMADFVSGADPRRKYAAMAAMMRHKLLMFSQLPMNVIFTAHLRLGEDQDIEEGKFPLVPDVQPSVQRVALAIPDVIGRTYIKDMNGKLVHVVQFGPDTRAVSKHRALGLPDEVANLTVTKLLEQIKPKKEGK